MSVDHMGMFSLAICVSVDHMGMFSLAICVSVDHMGMISLADGEAEVAGAPASPLDVVCHEANKDYVIISWKQPAVDGGSPILGYFVDRSVPIRHRRTTPDTLWCSAF